MTADPSELHRLLDDEAEYAEAHRDDPLPADPQGTRA